MVSEETKSKASEMAARVEEPVHQAHQLLQGQMPNNPDKALGHPIHPSTVHWPIAVSASPLPSPIQPFLNQKITRITRLFSPSTRSLESGG